MTWTLYEHKTNKIIRYWARHMLKWVEVERDRFHVAEGEDYYEIRTPYRVRGEPELPPELSVPSGDFPARGFEECYEEAK